MDDKEINIIDSYKIDDSHSKIRGIVSLYDESGNLVFTKENMILLDGRKAIFDSIFSRTKAPEIVGAVFGDSTALTTQNMTIQNMGNSMQVMINTSSNSENTDSEVITTENTSISHTYNSNGTIISELFTIELDKVAKREISCMGLLFKDNAGSTKLFSRVVFPTQYTSSNRKLTFKYYLYF